MKISLTEKYLISYINELSLIWLEAEKMIVDTIPHPRWLRHLLPPPRLGTNLDIVYPVADVAMLGSEYSSLDNYATIAHHTIIVMPPPLLLCNIRPSQRIPKIPPTLGLVSSLNISSLWLLAIVVYCSLLCSRYLLLNAAAKLLLKTTYQTPDCVFIFGLCHLHCLV